MRAANPLLDLALPLRTLPACADVEGLRAQLLQMVKLFEAEARASGFDTERLAAARYCLCTCIDEAISGTPWGSGMWASRSLLVIFHNEASGGERFFLILQRLAQDPARNVDVLELIYVMLSLGFEGRYRLLDGGRAQLESVRERLAQIIRVQRGSFEAELSVQWQPVQRARRSLTQRVPLWVAAALAGVVLVATHIALGVSLNRASDPVFDALNGVRVSAPPLMPAVAAAQPAATAKLATFLAPEIAQGLVSVRDSADRSVVTINGDGLFASGSAALEAAYEPLMARIAQALQAVPGKVVVTGHTDNQPPLSARFPVELGSVAGARRQCADIARRHHRHAGAFQRGRARRRRAACVQRHRCRPREEPARRDHLAGTGSVVMTRRCTSIPLRESSHEKACWLDQDAAGPHAGRRCRTRAGAVVRRAAGGVQRQRAARNQSQPLDGGCLPVVRVGAGLARSLAVGAARQSALCQQQAGNRHPAAAIGFERHAAVERHQRPFEPQHQRECGHAG